MTNEYRGLDSLKRFIAGTNTGPVYVPPTGKSFKVSGLNVGRFVNGKLAEELMEYDRLYTYQQLGFKLTPPTK